MMDTEYGAHLRQRYTYPPWVGFLNKPTIPKQEGEVAAILAGLGALLAILGMAIATIWLLRSLHSEKGKDTPMKLLEEEAAARPRHLGRADLHNLRRDWHRNSLREIQEAMLAPPSED